MLEALIETVQVLGCIVLMVIIALGCNWLVEKILPEDE